MGPQLGELLVLPRTVVKMVDFSHRPQSAKPLRRPNSSRRLRPGLSPRNTDLVPAQATPRASARTTALNRIGSASPLPQPVLRCKRRSQLPREQHPSTSTRASLVFLTGTVKAICTPLPMGATHRRGMRSEQPSKRRASTKAAAWWTVSPYRSMNFTRPMTEL